MLFDQPSIHSGIYALVFFSPLIDDIIDLFLLCVHYYVIYNCYQQFLYRHEEKIMDYIAQHIHKTLIAKLPSCTENLVGIASRVEEVNNLIIMGLNDVRFIGIWGMGGIVKTTIARKQSDNHFKRYAFAKDTVFVELMRLKG
ncbi:hypothetical protein RJT34_18017 [Clitoria ternatea]|uniref:NB-ARC domain-containing protein n=1 Tax=Clitoria ternatea TaxID=43366 RepID=A0AAN9PDU7_CLITE